MNFRNEHEIELEKCKQHITQLRRENEELDKTLHELNEKLRDSEQLKGHFISNVTNEIVNPFTSVLALAASIQKLKEGDIKLAHHMAGLIFEEAFHLDFQLKNIFAAALIEAGKEETSTSQFDLHDFAIQLNEYFKSLLGKKRITLSFNFLVEDRNGESLKFTTDKAKLDLILKNLISNSIKYSPEDSVVEVSFVVANDELRIEVSDQGKGIKPEDRKVIFDRFKQLDEKINSVNTGHGLGLSIVLAYAEMLGGWVNIGNNVNGGTAVQVGIQQGVDPGEWDDLEGFIIGAETSY
jgi:signal transduction histidine kinase